MSSIRPTARRMAGSVPVIPPCATWRFAERWPRRSTSNSWSTPCSSGSGEPGLGLVPPALGNWFAEELVPEDYQFDLAAAAQRLEAAGYVDTDGDGIRECPTDDCGPTGDLTFRMNYPTDNDEHPRVSDTLSGWWSEIGVAVEIQGLDSDALTSICCPAFDYDVMLWSWTSDTDPEGLLEVLTCDEIETGFSETGYCNPTYDELFAEQSVES